MLAEFARKMGKPMRVLAFAFSMLLAKEAMADEAKVDKTEQVMQLAKETARSIFAEVAA